MFATERPEIFKQVVEFVTKNLVKDLLLRLDVIVAVSVVVTAAIIVEDEAHGATNTLAVLHSNLERGGVCFIMGQHVQGRGFGVRREAEPEPICVGRGVGLHNACVVVFDITSWDSSGDDGGRVGVVFVIVDGRARGGQRGRHPAGHND